MPSEETSNNERHRYKTAVKGIFLDNLKKLILCKFIQRISIERAFSLMVK